MSFANGTNPLWSGYLADAQAYLPESNSRLALLILINTPIIAIILNALWQVVSC